MPDGPQTVQGFSLVYLTFNNPMRQLLPTTGIKRSKIKQTGRNAGFGCWLPAPNPWYCFSFPGKWGVCSVHSVSLRKDILDFPLGWNKCHRPPFTKVPGVP